MECCINQCGHQEDFNKHDTPQSEQAHPHSNISACLRRIDPGDRPSGVRIDPYEEAHRDDDSKVEPCHD